MQLVTKVPLNSGIKTIYYVNSLNKPKKLKRIHKKGNKQKNPNNKRIRFNKEEREYSLIRKRISKASESITAKIVDAIGDWYDSLTSTNNLFVDIDKLKE